MREEKAEDPGERGGELQKFTPGALGGGLERDRMGMALGSLGSWGRGGGQVSMDEESQASPRCFFECVSSP